MISAFLIVKGGSAVWPPPGQPRLPIEATAFNTAVLLASALHQILYLVESRDVGLYELGAGGAPFGGTSSMLSHPSALAMRQVVSRSQYLRKHQ